MPNNRAQARSETPATHLESIPSEAERFGVHPSTIRRYISAGRITGYRFGPRMIRVDPEELNQLLRPLASAGGDD